MRTARARLFGVDVEASPPLAGVPDEGPGGAQPLRIVRDTRAAVLAAAAGQAAERVVDHRDAAGRPALSVTRGEAGTLIVAREWGAYLIDAAVTTVRCAPARLPGWRWQRYLIGQVLPYASVLRGHEVLHASAVAVGGAAVAITGPSGAGKSTLAAAWILRGAPLVADDVVALDLAAGEARAHPGPGVLSVRPSSADLLGGAAALGRSIGEDEHGLRLAVARHAAALPLGALVFVERVPRGDRLEVQRVADPDPRLLLGTTFNLTVRTPERLIRQLDVCQAIARTVPVVHARIPDTSPPGETVERLEAVL